MPTCVLSANFLGERWINFLISFFCFVFKEYFVGGEDLFLQEFCCLSDGGQKGRSRQAATRGTVAVRSE